jgi:hypothetical protein
LQGELAAVIEKELLYSLVFSVLLVKGSSIHGLAKDLIYLSQNVFFFLKGRGG